MPVAPPAGSVTDRIVALWADPLTRPAGVLHVVAVGRAAGGGLGVIRIGPGAPASRTDRFALSVARARADVIVSTGRILREEASLVHDPGSEARAWRRGVLGKPDEPVLAILTRGAGLPLEHPALRRARVLVGVPRAAAAGLSAALGRRDARVVGLEDASLRGWVAELRRRGFRTVCVEAGPSTATSLYEDPLAVDELMLSIFEEHALPDRLNAGPFLAPGALGERFGAPRSEILRSETSGRWRFCRYARR